MTTDIRLSETADKGRYEPVVLPQEWPNTDFSGGVGSPQVLRNPDTLEKYLLFTGWTAQDQRHLFVADLEDDLSITNPRKILDYSTYGKVDGAYGQFDIINNEWVFAFSTNQVDGLRLIIFSEDFTSVVGQQSYSIGTKDSGATLFYGQDGTMFVSWADSGGYQIGEFLQRIDERPLPSSVATTKTAIPASDWFLPDVHHTRITPSGWMALIERKITNKGHWTVNPAFFGEAPTNPRAHMPMFSLKPLLSGAFNGGGSFGHPHYTTELGRPVLFFDYFRSLNVSAGDTHRHEIWTTEPSIDLEDPTEWFPFRQRPLDNNDTLGGLMNSFGSSKIIVHANVSGSSTINIEESSNTQAVDDGNASEREVGSPSASGTYRYVVDDPAMAFRFNANQNINWVDIELRE